MPSGGRTENNLVLQAKHKSRSQHFLLSLGSAETDVRLKSRQCGNVFFFCDALKVLSGFEFVSINLVCVLREEFISGLPVRYI